MGSRQEMVQPCARNACSHPCSRDSSSALPAPTHLHIHPPTPPHPYPIPHLLQMTTATEASDVPGAANPPVPPLAPCNPPLPRHHPSLHVRTALNLLH